MTSDHLDISYVWKSLVASCVCVWLKFKCTLSMCSSSSPDHHKTRSSLAINPFVCSVISYSEVSSKGYLVTSDKRVCLQYDIVLGGE